MYFMISPINFVTPPVTRQRSYRRISSSYVVVMGCYTNVDRTYKQRRCHHKRLTPTQNNAFFQRSDFDNIFTDSDVGECQMWFFESYTPSSDRILLQRNNKLLAVRINAYLNMSNRVIENIRRNLIRIEFHLSTASFVFDLQDSTFFVDFSRFSLYLTFLVFLYDSTVHSCK